MANNQDAAAIALRYGQSTDNFTTASANTLEAVLQAHCNEGIKIMSKTIGQKTKRGYSSELAQSLDTYPIKTSSSITIVTFTNKDYWKYVNYGVKGTRRNKGAIKSRDGVVYAFKNLYTPPKMIESFKKWIAQTGTKTYKNKEGKRKSLYKKTKDGKKVFRYDRQQEAAEQLARATKIGGIKPVKFEEKANNPIRTRELTKSIKSAMGQLIKIQVKKF